VFPERQPGMRPALTRTAWCVVTVCDAPGAFAYRTQGRLMSDSTEWYFELRADAGGTATAQDYRVRRLPLWADRLTWRAWPPSPGARPRFPSRLPRLRASSRSGPERRSPPAVLLRLRSNGG